MLYDFIMTDKSDSLPLYRQIYRSVRESIENGSMKMNSRLPSIRRLSDNLGVSKTTVIAAYDQLCAEGYIVNRPQKGFFVAADFQNSPAQIEAKKDYSNIENKHYEYDVWRKEVKDIINRSYLLTSYGDVQGEEALRNALQKYALGTRSVNARAENIVVGAGTQAILSLLCSLLGGGKRVAVQEKSFVQAEYVLRSFGNEIFYILLINPNYAGTEGKTMPVARRLEIIEWAAKNNALIIEDDYNGELRYSTHPTPCVQNHGTEQTVYIGSFSKVLLPSVRISYMVLPEKLIRQYNAVRELLNQTASKTEQLALASYIQSGKIDAHIRKARRIYLEKARVMHECLNKYFPGCRLIFNETAMYFGIAFPEQVDRQSIDRELKNHSVRLMPQQHDDNHFGVSFSGIPISKIEEGIALTSRIIHQNTTGKPAAE